MTEKILVTVVRAKDLLSKDDNGFSDPYVILKVGSESFTTQIIYKTLNPEFNETFVLFAFFLHCIWSVALFFFTSITPPPFFFVCVCVRINTEKQKNMNPSEWKCGTRMCSRLTIMRGASR